MDGFLSEYNENVSDSDAFDPRKAVTEIGKPDGDQGFSAYCIARSTRATKMKYIASTGARSVTDARE